VWKLRAAPGGERMGECVQKAMNGP
jgi:hypothetical protein